MSERKVEVTREYTPAPGRCVVVESVPAMEVTIGPETLLTFELDVVERVQEIVKYATASSTESSVHVKYGSARIDAGAAVQKAISFAPDISDLQSDR